MKYSIQYSDALHILAYIHIYRGTQFLSSEMIARSVETNPANVRKMMASLKKADLLHSSRGRAQPTLAREPQDISLLDVYRAIEGNTRLIQVDAKTNPDCVVGAHIQAVLTVQYDRLQAAVENEMKDIHLDRIIRDIAKLEVQKRPENQNLLADFL